MRGRRAGLLLAAAIAVPILSGMSPASAASPPKHGLVLMFVVDQVSFEQLMTVPQVRGLAGVGGSGLMTTKAGSGDRVRAGYLTLGAGSIQSASGTSRLLATDLEARGVDVCIEGGGGSSGRAPGDPVRLLGMDATGSVKCDLGPVTAPSLPPLTTSLDALVIIDLTPKPPCPPSSPCGFQPASPDLQPAGALVSSIIGSLGDRRTLAMVVTPTTSPEMEAVGDEVTPLVAAEGRAGRLLSATGPMHGLTSDSTRQDGLVSNVDVAPTVLSFFGLPVPSAMDGQPVRPTDGGPPFGLHRLHLEQRRIRLPIQLGELAIVVVTGLIGIAALIALALRGALPPGVARVLRFMVLSDVALSIPLFAGGLLPRLTYTVVVPFVLLSMLALAAVSLAARWDGPLGPFTFLGAVGLTLVVIDAALGSRASRIPLLGGTMFDGVRFYGLPNSFLALLLGSALFVAATFDPLRGFLVLVAAGLFAGFPRLGADLGGATMVFAAAGLWWVLRTRRRFGVTEAAIAVGVTVAGVAVVLAVNRFLPGAPTHVARFVERTGANPSGALGTLHHRLSVAFGQLTGHPEAFVPLVGLVVVLWLAIARPDPIARALAPYPAWQDMLVALTAASLIGFLANDTGVSAAAPGFLYAMSALAYPAYLLVGRGSGERTT